VPPNQLHAFCADDGLDLGSHEFGSVAIRPSSSRGNTRERGELEFEKLPDVEGGLLVLQEKRSFFRLVFARSSTPRSIRNCAHS